jgi:hypothetical protein
MLSSDFPRVASSSCPMGYSWEAPNRWHLHWTVHSISLLRRQRNAADVSSPASEQTGAWTWSPLMVCTRTSWISACHKVTFHPSSFLHSQFLVFVQVTSFVKIKVTFRPRTGRDGPEGKWKYSSILSLTSALDRGGWLTLLPGRFTAGKETRYPPYKRLNGSQGRLEGCGKFDPHRDTISGPSSA